MRVLLASFLLASIFTSAVADHESGAAWSWHVVSAGLDESRVALYRQQQLVGIFNFSCDLTATADSDDGENGPSLELVEAGAHPGGLLLLKCNVGAHSQHLAIVDPSRKTGHVVFTRTGSYFVEWEIQDGELWISYDQPCETGPSVDCPDGYETVFVRYPPES